MKRHFYALGLMLAATFTLTNCAEEIDQPVVDEPVAGVPFEIVASTADTKTVNDGLSTKWDDDDAINLFHAVAGSTEEYGTNDKFTIADVENGRFTGTLTEALEAEGSYDWYALYPYSSNIATPGERETGYTYIGHSKGLAQDGYDSKASLKETICPLYGVAKSVASSETPSITMEHLTSVVAIKVTNETENPLTITEASFTAEKDIVGSYYIDITKNPVVYTASQGYVSNTAVVNVSNGTALNEGESATLYLAIKPFTAAIGEELTLSVNGYSKPVVLEKEVKFKEGVIKTIPFAYDKVEEPAPEGVTEVSIVSKDLGIENAVDVTSVNDGLLVFAQGTNTNNAPKYYSTGEAIRMYTGNTLTVTAPSGNVLTKIEFGFVSGYNQSLSCTNSNSYSNGLWTGELDKVVFNVSGGSQARITKIVVTYVEGEVEAAEMTGIEVVDPKTDYILNTEFVEPTVNAIYSNGTVNSIDGATFEGYDLSVPGEQTVTVTYEDFTVTYDIVVSEASGDSYCLYSGDLVEGDYLIVYDGVAMKASVASSRLQYLDVEVVDDVVYDPDPSVVWHIAKSGDYWTIYNASENKYAAGTGAKNKAQLLDSGSDDKSLWTASGTNSYEFVNKANAAAGVNKNLRRNTTYGFACYSTSTGGALTLYKLN